MIDILIGVGYLVGVFVVFFGMVAAVVIIVKFVWRGKR